MKNISIIVPIHELTEENKGLLETALKSVEDFHNDVTVLIVGPRVSQNLSLICHKS